jgi:hypothetical protein
VLTTDPIDLMFGEDGDLELGPDGDLQFTTGPDAVRQLLQHRLNLIKGEWFLDLDAGVPYFEREGVSADQALLGQTFDRQKALRAFAQEISACPGVTGIVSLEVDFDPATRVMEVSWVVTTEFGDTVEDSLAKGA